MKPSFCISSVPVDGRLLSTFSKHRHGGQEYASFFHPGSLLQPKDTSLPQILDRVRLLDRNHHLEFSSYRILHNWKILLIQSHKILFSLDKIYRSTAFPGDAFKKKDCSTTHFFYTLTVSARISLVAHVQKDPTKLTNCN